MKLPKFDFYSSVITALFVACAAALIALLMSCAAPKDPLSLYSPMWQNEPGYNCPPPFNTNQLPE